MPGYGSYGERLESAFRPFGPLGEAKPIRLDAWITPPGYTGRAPIFLTGDAAAATDHIVKVPSGSELVVRVHGAPDAAVTFADAKGERPLEPPPAAKPDGDKDQGKDGTDGKDLRPPRPRGARSGRAQDEAHRRRHGEGDETAATSSPAGRSPSIPTIRRPSNGSPTRSAPRRRVEFAYEVKDDYGIVDAEARITPMPDPNGGDPAGRRPAGRRAEGRLCLPAGGKAGAAKTVADLTKHPFAGSTVAVVLVARDEAGHEAVTPPVDDHAAGAPVPRAARPRGDRAAPRSRPRRPDPADGDRLPRRLMLAPEGIFPTTTSYLGTASPISTSRRRRRTSN